MKSSKYWKSETVKSPIQKQKPKMKKRKPQMYSVQNFEVTKYFMWEVDRIISATLSPFFFLTEDTDSEKKSSKITQLIKQQS